MQCSSESSCPLMPVVTLCFFISEAWLCLQNGSSWSWAHISVVSGHCHCLPLSQFTILMFTSIHRYYYDAVQGSRSFWDQAGRDSYRKSCVPMGVSLEVVSKLPETWRDAPFREARMTKRCRKVTECYRLALSCVDLDWVNMT